LNLTKLIHLVSGRGEVNDQGQGLNHFSTKRIKF
jgi:hypothetical protein